MTGFESDEFLSFDFDEPFVFKKPTSDRFVVYNAIAIYEFVYISHSCS